MLSDVMKKAAEEARNMAAARGIKASIHLHHENSHLMRIGNNSVSLNTGEELTRTDIEVIDGRRRGTHTHLGQINSADRMFELVLKVAEKAAVSSEMDYQPVLPAISENIYTAEQYHSAVDGMDPSEKEKVYSAIIRECGEEYNYSGSWSSGSTETFLVTTATKFSAGRLVTDQQFSCVLKHPKKLWELGDWQTGWKAEDVTAEKTINRFRNLLPLYEEKDGFKVEPGHYKVAFGPEALGDLLSMAVWTGCSGRTWEMKMGWTSDNKLGDTILSEKITVLDDPGSPDVFSDPVSDTGMPTEMIPLVENGKLASLIYDRNTASKYGKEAGPNAGNLAMQPGDGPADMLEALKDYDRVLYIPAIHYMNLPNMSKGVFTGSSRFSAVLIEKGKIVSPIFSSRITDSFQTVFGKVLAISSETVSSNRSNTYGRRSPSAVSVATWLLADDVKITDCADSF
ncbi:hypothetical protein CSA37_12945 [Candidatus Fermentibacteria bacterium]|nr:MAG: hypothetical protein CSA37_12945 [Candidatus Fermentibacteria bacterium]